MAEQAKLDESNMANYGGKEHRDMKKAAASKEKAWNDVGQKPGVQVWRIEKFKVKHWPKERYGEFFGGDSYIILHTKENEEGKREFDVFFWLGSETTQDEAGTAAYKTVELDDLLGDEPVQYREVEGNESKGFLQIFPKMHVLKGGIATGFNHVKPKEYKPRLLHVCGFGKKVQVYEKPLKHESLNDSDCFVLDCGLILYQFNGGKSSAWEKRKANAIVDGLKAARHGKVKDGYTIDGLNDKGSPLIENFWTHFGGRPDKIKDEEAVPKPKEMKLSLHHVSDASGKMIVKEVCSGKLDKSALDSDDAFILDAGTKLYVWIGKGANKSEKREAMQWAVEYLNSNSRDSRIPMVRCMEGKEPSEFWAAFAGQKVGGRQDEFKKWKSGK